MFIALSGQTSLLKEFKIGPEISINISVLRTFNPTDSFRNQGMNENYDAQIRLTYNFLMIMSVLRSTI